MARLRTWRLHAKNEHFTCAIALKEKSSRFVEE